jgi:hypothetical protein
VPNQWPNRNAVSPVIERLPAMIWLTVRRHGDLSRKFSGRDAQFRQFVLQNAARMHNSPEHDEAAFHQ